MNRSFFRFLVWVAVPAALGAALGSYAWTTGFRSLRAREGTRLSSAAEVLEGVGLPGEALTVSAPPLEGSGISILIFLSVIFLLVVLSAVTGKLVLREVQDRDPETFSGNRRLQLAVAGLIPILGAGLFLLVLDRDLREAAEEGATRSVTRVSTLVREADPRVIATLQELPRRTEIHASLLQQGAVEASTLSPGPLRDSLAALPRPPRGFTSTGRVTVGPEKERWVWVGRRLLDGDILLLTAPLRSREVRRARLHLGGAGLLVLLPGLAYALLGRSNRPEREIRR